MNCLVVEDDPIARRILGRLISSAFGADVAEAADGLEALRQIEEGSPDLVITDVMMPNLDGLGLLRSIRASAEHRDLPVVAVSASGERHQVAQLIALGISEYLLKPLDLAATVKRLGRVIQEIKAKPRTRRLPAAGVEGGQRTLLLVDPDPNFRTLFKTLLGDQFVVLEAASGSQGLAAAIQHQPTTVCLSEGLGLLSEWQLLERLRALPKPPTGIYLMQSGVSPAGAELFDGALVKTFVPEALAERWGALAVSRDLLGSIAWAMAGPFQSEVVTAAQQTFGVMVGQEVEPVPEDQAESLSREVVSMARLAVAGAAYEIQIAIATSEAEASRIAGLILGQPAAWNEGASGVIGTLLETLAGRIRSSFNSRSIKLNQTSIGPVPPEELDPAPAFRAGFAIASGERFILEVSQPRPI